MNVLRTNHRYYGIYKYKICLSDYFCWDSSGSFIGSYVIEMWMRKMLGLDNVKFERKIGEVYAYIKDDDTLVMFLLKWGK